MKHDDIFLAALTGVLAAGRSPYEAVNDARKVAAEAETTPAAQNAYADFVERTARHDPGRRGDEARQIFAAYTGVHVAVPKPLPGPVYPAGSVEGVLADKAKATDTLTSLRDLARGATYAHAALAVDGVRALWTFASGETFAPTLPPPASRELAELRQLTRSLAAATTLDQINVLTSKARAVAKEFTL